MSDGTIAGQLIIEEHADICKHYNCTLRAYLTRPRQALHCKLNSSCNDFRWNTIVCQ